jgi:hypothetical protein
MSLTRSLAFSTVVLVALPCIADPTPLHGKADARALTDAVMQLVAADKIDEALGKLRPHWRIPSNEIDTVVMKTITMRNTVGDRYGHTVGHAFVREDDVGDFLVRYTYVEKRVNHPLRWTFIFYRATDEWWVDSAAWDDNVSALFTP